MNTRIALRSLALLVASATAGSLRAQVVLQPGLWVEGALEPSDPCDERGSVYDAYRFPPGFLGVFRLTVEAEAFDVTVRVEAPLGEVIEILADNDDFPGLPSGTDARAYGRVRSGQYPEIQVRSWSGEAAGRYRIRMDTLPRATAAAAAVPYGADLRGSLEESDAYVNGAFEDRFRFAGVAGDVVRVLLQSEDFDAFLELWDEENRFIAQDDDGFEIDDAWIEVELPASGTYEIRVRPSPGVPPSRRAVLGEYRLRLGPGLDVSPDPTLGGLAFTDTERAGLRFDDREIRNDALGFRFPAPTVGFTVTNVSVTEPEAWDPTLQMWSVRSGKAGEELLVWVTKPPKPMDAVRLHRVAKVWVELSGGTFLEERMDWEGSRSVRVLVEQPWISPQPLEVRCRASGEERAPPLLVCLCDGGSFAKSLAGLNVR